MIHLKNNKLTKKDVIEVNQQKERQLVLDDIIIPRKGHKLFKINIKTLKVEEAKGEISYFVFNGINAYPVRTEVIKESGFFYTSARDHIRALKNYYNNDNGSLKKKGKKYLKL